MDGAIEQKIEQFMSEVRNGVPAWVDIAHSNDPAFSDNNAWRKYNGATTFINAPSGIFYFVLVHYAPEHDFNGERVQEILSLRIDRQDPGLKNVKINWGRRIFSEDYERLEKYRLPEICDTIERCIYRSIGLDMEV